MTFTPARASLLVGAAVAAVALVALPARATYGARTTADEPQYLLSALSLAQDRDLWIDDELDTRAYAPFHEAPLPVQTEPTGDGHEVSPHDPLLPAVLAVPVGLGGWAAAKATLAVLAGALAAVLTWIAHRRLGVSLGAAALTVTAFGVTAPLTSYATQVYPELPAALLVTVGLALLLRPAAGATPQPSFRDQPDARGRVMVVTEVVGLGVVVTLLPWLGIKYAPVAAALAAVGLWQLWRGRRPAAAFGLVVGLAAAGLAYLVAHRLIYGGWTVYAAGDHFVGGELTVVGTEPDYAGRSRRLLGLVFDRGFGLAAWMPGYLLAVPAVVLLLRRRPRGWLAVAAPLAAGWATATWVALTMHGWWWPGRQTVVVLPCLVLAVAWWASRPARWRQARLAAVAAAGAVGALNWLWLVGEVLAGDRRLIIDFEGTRNPFFRAWHSLLPDYRHPGVDDWLLQAGWLVAIAVGLAVVAWLPETQTSRRRPAHVAA